MPDFETTPSRLIVMPGTAGDLPPSSRNPAGENGNAEEGIRIPPELPLLPLRNMVLFPDMILPLVVDEERDIALVDAVLLKDRVLGLVPQIRPGDGPPGTGDLFHHACAGVILKMLKFPDNTIRLLVQGLSRVRIVKYAQEEPFFVAHVEVYEEREPDESTPRERRVRLNALLRTIRERFQRLGAILPNFPEEIKVATMNVSQPGRLADLVASNINLSMEERCALLEALDVQERLERLSVFLERELQVVELGAKIQNDVQTKVGKGQRDFFLREQLKAIKRELGEEDDAGREIEELREELEKAGLPKEAREEADRELKRLEAMQPGSAEWTVSRTYLDWMATMPWSKTTEDLLDIRRAQKVMDEDHYGLEKIKERIIEYLAVRKVHPEGRGPILCFAGPPGVGKTSLGRSIARAMGRKFVRVSLGGVRDEAEIRGHRRTYIGALPGRVIQGLRKAGSRNPVFMMDEIDKLASDFRGDPASALLEVLDPEQNNAFVDHYLDIAFDLSRVMFITTANSIETVPPALRDRMEVLPIAGYAEEEKLQIARRHLTPKLLAEHGLSRRQIRFTAAGLRAIIGDYTREAGLRNLERAMAKICRRAAVEAAQGKRGPVVVDAARARSALGPKRFHVEAVGRNGAPGVATGLAWTPTGGDVLFVEAARMPGKGNLLLTGQLGEVMKESARAALTWIRSRSEGLDLVESADKLFARSDFHIHVPEGAIPKDGPSAGVTVIASLLSLLTGRAIRPRLAMTGEITLRGRVLPVGGIKEKMLAARRAGIREVILPMENESDLPELPAPVRRDLTFHPVETVDEALGILFDAPHKKGKAKRGKTRTAKKTTSRRSPRRR